MQKAILKARLCNARTSISSIRRLSIVQESYFLNRLRSMPLTTSISRQSRPSEPFFTSFTKPYFVQESLPIRPDLRLQQDMLHAGSSPLHAGSSPYKTHTLYKPTTTPLHRLILCSSLFLVRTPILSDLDHFRQAQEAVCTKYNRI
jgi:hypothetical protein